MGPDCGTAIINGVGLCFANKVSRGSIGLVAASGTGLQEVSVLIDRFGGGSLWPEDTYSRGFGRAMAAEMHSGLSVLRNEMPMNCRTTKRRVEVGAALQESWIVQADEAGTELPGA